MTVRIFFVDNTYTEYTLQTWMDLVFIEQQHTRIAEVKVISRKD